MIDFIIKIEMKNIPPASGKQTRRTIVLRVICFQARREPKVSVSG